MRPALDEFERRASAVGHELARRRWPPRKVRAALAELAPLPHPIVRTLWRGYVRELRLAQGL